jgi:hypothetical protein
MVGKPFLVSSVFWLTTLAELSANRENRMTTQAMTGCKRLLLAWTRLGRKIKSK